MNEFTPYPIKRTLRITLRERTSPVKVFHDSSWHLQVHGYFSSVKSEQNACTHTFRINRSVSYTILRTEKQARYKKAEAEVV